MAINPLLRSNPVRMMGMASGMDTDSIIQATLRMHQFKIDNQMRNRTLIEWKQQIHNDLKNQITSLRQTFMSALGSKTLMTRSAFNASIATASTKSGAATKAVSVSSTVGASIGSMTIDQVVSLAKGASYSSSGKVSQSGDGFTTGSTLSSLKFYDGGATVDDNGKAIGSGITFSNYDAAVTGADGGNRRITQDYVNSMTIDGTAGNWSTGEYATVTANGNTLNIIREGDPGDYTYRYEVTDKNGEVYDSGTLTMVNGEASTGEISGFGSEKNVFTIKEDAEGKTTISAKNESGKETLKSTDLSYARRATVEVDGLDVKLELGEDGVVRNNGKALNYTGYTSFEIEDVSTGNVTTINLNTNMTITQMMDAVNKSDAGVTLSYDRMTDTFKFESKSIVDAGEKDFILRDTAGGDVLSKLFGYNVSTDAPNGVPQLSDISNSSRAHVIINGESIYRDTNSFSYRGVNLTLNEVTQGKFLLDEDGEPTTTLNPNYDPIVVSVERDVTKPMDAIKEFIDNYNVLIKRLEDMLNERKKGNEVSYKPLTDEEKSAMTEKQIEDWEAIAKKGIMRDDRGIQNLVSSLRATFFEQIEGTGLSASQLGLTTGSYFDGTGGQIVLNEDKLRAALEADPDKVADVFIRIDSNGQGVGLMHQLNKKLNDYVGIGGTQSITLESLERSMKEMNDRIFKMEERMYAEEDKLYRQFAAMETALSKMQQQGDWFAAMLGGTA